jgi:hypothetical protein
MASPTQKAPKQNNTQLSKHRLVDLTLEEDIETKGTPLQTTTSQLSQQNRPKKRQKRISNPHYTQQKSVHWTNEEINFYNPTAPASKLIPNQHMTNHMFPNNYTPTNPPIFPPAPIPQPILAPFSTNPFFNQQQNIFNAGTQNQFLQNQNPFLHPPYLSEPLNNKPNPFKQNNTRRGQNRYPCKKRKLKSRRVIQRRAKRYKKMSAIEAEKPLRQSSYHTKQYCLKNFGFIADPTLSLQRNFNQIIKTSNIQPLQPSNLTFHNLCKNIKLPSDTRKLLDLNLKYCLSKNNFNQNINKILLQMAYSIRTKFYDINHESTDYEKQIYTKKKTMYPPPASNQIEDKLTENGMALKLQQTLLNLKNSFRNLNNLTTAQLKTLNLLKQNKNLLIKPTDKSLGPSVLDTCTYIKQVLNEHLLSKDYKQLSATEAKNLLDKAKTTLQKLIIDNQNLLSKAEFTYFKRNMYEFKRIPIFYGLP